MGTIIADIINILNDFDIRYKAQSSSTGISLHFGLLGKGEKYALVIDSEDNLAYVEIKEIGNKSEGGERNIQRFDSEEFKEFVQHILQLRNIQKEEESLMSKIGINSKTE